MRKLASFDDSSTAKAVTEVLYASDIRSELRKGPDDTAVVWVLTEEDLARAHELLADFMRDPDNDRYADARAAAKAKHDAAKRAERESRHKVVVVRKTFRQRAAQSPVTLTIIVASFAVGLATHLGQRTDLLAHLTIVSFQRSGAFVRWAGYSDLLHGQLWRLFTPILIHFGPFHLLFNVFWMNDLGAPTERYQGSFRYFLFLLWSSATSNLAQLYFGHSPSFGGLSGVIYALVGYLWARGRADPLSGIALPGRLVGFFMVWMLLGFSGLLSELVGQMANYCHLGGFAAGAVYGYIAAQLAIRARR